MDSTAVIIGNEVSNLGVLLVAFLTSIGLGVMKTFVFPVDSKLMKLIRPIQPMIVTIVPVLVQMIGVQLVATDTALIAAAPASAIIIITLREIFVKLKPKE